MIWKPLVSPGTTIYDPYMGGGSILRSAILKGARVIGTEKKEHHYVQALESIKKVFTQVQGKHVEFS
jgi:tRNA G10  N-methylase Trm11